jgi:hypothetical protein
MTKLKLTEEQRTFLKNNFDNFSKEQIKSKVQLSMWGGIPVGKPVELKDYCTIEGIERQIVKAGDMTAGFIFYAFMYTPTKWRLDKMLVTKLEVLKND